MQLVSNFSRRAVLSLGLAMSFCASGVVAQSLPAPTGTVLLTVTGAISETNLGDAATFDLDLLMSLEQVEVTTTTIWTDGAQTFTGVSLRALMSALGAKGSALSATAVNNYSVEIPFEDVTDGSALLAYKRNGETMSVRDKGPLWIIYPYDDDSRFQSEVYYSRSIWQLDRLEVQG